MQNNLEKYVKDKIDRLFIQQTVNLEGAFCVRTLLKCRRKYSEENDVKIQERSSMNIQ